MQALGKKVPAPLLPLPPLPMPHPYPVGGGRERGASTQDWRHHGGGSGLFPRLRSRLCSSLSTQPTSALACSSDGKGDSDSVNPEFKNSPRDHWDH